MATPLKKHLVPLLLEQKKWILISFFFALGVALVQIQTSVLVKNLMDGAIIPKDFERTLSLCGLLILWFFLEGIFDFFHKFSLRLGAERLVRDLRNRIFNKYLIFSRAISHKYTSGKAVTNISLDIASVSLALVYSTNILKEPLVLIGLFGYLFYLNVQLTLVCLLAVPMLLVVGWVLGKSARRNQRKIQIGQESVMAQIIESVQGLETAQTLGRPEVLALKFSEKTQEVYKVFLRLIRAEELNSPLSKWVGSFFGAGLIGYAGFLVSKGQMTPGELTAFIVTAGRIQQPLRLLNDVNVKFQQAAAAAERLRSTLDEQLDDVSRSQESAFALGLARIKGATKIQTQIISDLSHNPPTIEFVNVSFRYPKSNFQLEDPASQHTEGFLALKDLSLALKPGEKWAIVGRSGAGKSTFIRLLLRLMDPTEGRVLIDNKNAREIPLNDYRNYFSYVPQESFLLSESLRSNFEFIRKPQNDDEIWDALEKAHASEVVKRFSQGLDQPLGENASVLSGGEKQRISIARAFYKNSPVVVLDEATSQLDAHNENLLRESLKTLMNGRTAVIIAHRLTTVRSVDSVAVFEKGQLIETGRPSDLLKTNSSAFLALWQAQGNSLSVHS